MARLSSDVIRAIVTRLACYDRPAEVAKYVLETFRVEVTLPHILYYDPTSAGTDVAKKWRKLFAETRAAFTRDLTSIPIAQRAYRMQQMQKIHNKNMDRGALAFARDDLVEAEKMTGDYYTNRRMVLPGDQNSLAEELSKLLGVGKDDVLAAIPGGGE